VAAQLVDLLQRGVALAARPLALLALQQELGQRLLQRVLGLAQAPLERAGRPVGLGRLLLAPGQVVLQLLELDQVALAAGLAALFGHARPGLGGRDALAQVAHRVGQRAALLLVARLGQLQRLLRGGDLLPRVEGLDHQALVVGLRAGAALGQLRLGRLQARAQDAQGLVARVHRLAPRGLALAGLALEQGHRLPGHLRADQAARRRRRRHGRGRRRLR
jgi:hypothetical protein